MPAVQLVHAVAWYHAYVPPRQLAQTVCADSKWPGVHSVQRDWPAALIKPASQMVHTLWPATAYVPATHVSQTVAFDSENVPVAHVEHCVVSQYRPASHGAPAGLHVVLPVADLKPAGHEPHDVTLVGMLLAGQSRHTLPGDKYWPLAHV